MYRSIKRWMSAGIVLFSLAPAAWADDRDQIVHIRLRGAVMESPPPFDLGALFGEEDQPTMLELIETLRKARADESVRALVFDLDEAELNLAQIQELRAQFEQLRAADKDIWVYIEQVGPGGYLLASAAGKVVMMPRGTLFVIGLHAAPMYFRGLLDKIGVQADVVHCGAFKSAGEPFTRAGPSPEAEADVNKILDGIWEYMLGAVAKSRRMTPDQARKAFDNGPYGAQEALDAGLVDALDYRQDFARGLRKRYGDDVKIVRDYGRKKGPALDFENPFALFQLFGEMMQGPRKPTSNAVAVIYVDGAIMTGRSDEGFGGGFAGSTRIRKAIDEAARDEKIKAVVLRVDSPGGSAVASEIITEAAQRCRRKKPVIVSMGGVAASGGYYVSCLADAVVAQPATIAGSIGVVGMNLVTTDMWGKLGITRHEYQRGAGADLMSGLRPWTDDHRARIMKMMNRVYDEFKGRVTEGRGSRIKGDIESLAGGRVYTGSQALEVGLVDHLGGLADAIRFAADRAKVSKYEIRVLPAPKTFADLLSKGLGMRDKDEELRVRLGPPPALAAPEVRAALHALQTVDPRGAAELRAALRHLQTLQRENVLLIAPALPSVR